MFSKQAAIRELVKLSEAELQSQIVEPLLRHQGFTHVRNTGGMNDKGKDLTAIREEFGKAKFYAIQIKKMQFSGQHASANSLTRLTIQLRQALNEKSFDSLSNIERFPQRILFITPYEID